MWPKVLNHLEPSVFVGFNANQLTNADKCRRLQTAGISDPGPGHLGSPGRRRAERHETCGFHPVGLRALAVGSAACLGTNIVTETLKGGDSEEKRNKCFRSESKSYRLWESSFSGVSLRKMDPIILTLDLGQWNGTPPKELLKWRAKLLREVFPTASLRLVLFQENGSLGVVVLGVFTAVKSSTFLGFWDLKNRIPSRLPKEMLNMLRMVTTYQNTICRLLTFFIFSIVWCLLGVLLGSTWLKQILNFPPATAATAPSCWFFQTFSAPVSLQASGFYQGADVFKESYHLVWWLALVETTPRSCTVVEVPRTDFYLVLTSLPVVTSCEGDSLALGSSDDLFLNEGMFIYFASYIAIMKDTVGNLSCWMVSNNLALSNFPSVSTRGPKTQVSHLCHGMTDISSHLFLYVFVVNIKPKRFPCEFWTALDELSNDFYTRLGPTCGVLIE